MSRDPAMLRPNQRAFLRGEKEYNQQVRTNTRYEIRKRVRNTLLDFALLLDQMEARDRKQVFKDVRPPSLRSDEEYTDEAFREDEVGGLIQTLAFLFLGADDAGIPFEPAMEQAIVTARGADATAPFVAQTVDVTVDEELATDTDRIFSKIERGESLYEIEYFGLTRLVLADLAAFIEGASGVDIDIWARLDAGESLTRGESLVAVGQVLAGAPELREYELLDRLHDDVITHLGLSNARFR